MKAKISLIFFMILVAGFLYAVQFFVNHDSTPLLSVVETGEVRSMEPLENNWWWVEIQLQPGVYHYFFESGGERFTDPGNSRTAMVDGQEVSIVKVGDDSIRHIISDRDYFNPVNEGEIYLAVSTPSDGDYRVVAVSGGERFELIYSRDFGNIRFYRSRPLALEEVSYYFEIHRGEETLFLDATGLKNYLERPFEFSLQALPVSFFDTPEWSKGALYYQIFPERFANGNPGNDPENVQQWYIDTKTANLGGDGFFGGDLQGIIDRFDHLLGLGVEAIYLNPIFESPSSHKYDTQDYMRIDDNFGDDETFEELSSLAHDHGIRLILDGVFNHTGYDFFAFKDLRESGESSPYKDWYFVKSFPIRKVRDRALSYVGWNGYAYMPKVNSLNPQWQDYIKRLVEKYDIDGVGGWRLDVATEVAPEFWSDFFRPLVKSLDEEMILVAEFWGDAKSLLRGKSFDSAMNYPFKDAVVEYVFRAGNSAGRFVAMTNFYLNAYPPQTLHSLWNILDSHDTERIMTLAFNQRDLMKIAVAIQMTFIGSPVIYYGDEVGMKGGKDPENRAPMIWDDQRWDMEVFDFYRKLIEIRKTHTALKTGDYSVLASEGPVLGYIRSLGEDRVIVLTNPSRERATFTVSLEGRYVENLTGREFDFKPGAFEIPPTTVWILTPAGER